jgi:AhpD family alkylhydroperoxidase
MRLQILDRGHRLVTRAVFALIRLMSRQPVPEAVKLVMYRPDFYGSPMKAVTQGAMRGPSAWSVADRELIAAYVSKLNACVYCTQAHSAVSSRASGDARRVAAALTDLDGSSLANPLRATLTMLRTLIQSRTLRPADVHEALAGGVTVAQLEEALEVAFAFNTMNRLADTFGFAVGGPEAFESGAKYLLARGYR